MTLAAAVGDAANGCDAQGTGLGNAPLAAVEERARECGADRLSLIAGERLRRNIAWYLRRGYAIERTEDLAGRRVLHMRKPLGIQAGDGRGG
jgi:hypothetical protein